MLAELGVADADGLATTLHREFTRMENYVLFDDVRPDDRGAAEAGLLLGIVSNFEAWLEEWFGVHELVETFPVRVISGIEGIEKPDQRIFRLALERAGVDAAESAYVGDNPEFDVDPPAALGHVPGARRPPGPIPRPRRRPGTRPARPAGDSWRPRDESGSSRSTRRTRSWRSSASGCRASARRGSG